MQDSVSVAIGNAGEKLLQVVLKIEIKMDFVKMEIKIQILINAYPCFPVLIR